MTGSIDRVIDTRRKYINNNKLNRRAREKKQREYKRKNSVGVAGEPQRIE